MDPVSAGLIIGGGLQAIGGLLKGDGGKKKDRAEEQRQFDEQIRLQQELGRTGQTMDQVDQIGDVTRSMENAPLRDKILYMLQQRSGMTPAEFRPRDMANPWTSGSQAPSMGGIDAGAMATAAGNYKPGAGGVDPRVYEAMRTKLGLKQGPGGPSIGNVDILDPHVEWQRAGGVNAHNEMETRENARRRGVSYTPPAPPPPTGLPYQPPWKGHR